MIDVIRNQILDKQLTSDMLFYCKIDIDQHVTKKNGRPVFINKYTKKAVMGKTPKLKSAESSMRLKLRSEANRQHLYTPIDFPIWVIMHFYFDNFYNKDGTLNKKIPDLSNLYELPQDILQDVGIILNDNLIHSHDLSRKLPAMNNSLEIFIIKHELGT